MRLDMENSAAKEQQHQQSVSSGGGDPLSTTAGAAAQYQNPYSPPQLANQQQMPIVYVAAAIAMAIFGLILGKFVLWTLNDTEKWSGNGINRNNSDSNDDNKLIWAQTSINNRTETRKLKQTN